MSRIMAFDFGEKRTGVAVTDPTASIASPLETVETPKVISFIQSYLAKEKIVRFVVGMPKSLSGKSTDATAPTHDFIRRLKKNFPEIPVNTVDERFTSGMARQAIGTSGIGRERKKEKALVDRVSAAIILQSFLEERSFNDNRNMI